MFRRLVVIIIRPTYGAEQALYTVFMDAFMDKNITIRIEAHVPVLRQGGQDTWGAERLDRYHRPGKWLKPAREVEKWRLQDGRVLKISRAAGKDQWEFEALL